MKRLAMSGVLVGTAFIIYGAAVLMYRGEETPMLWAWFALGFVFIAEGIMTAVVKKRAAVVSAIAVSAAEAVFLVGLLVFSGFALSYMGSSPEQGCDHVIILGAAVNGDAPSEALQKRIDSAYMYLDKNNGSVAVGTGGKGAGENISEGKCIADSLEKMGIEKSRIIYEEGSATTVENLDNALKLMGNSKSIAIVSSGFHVFRAKLLLSCRTDADITVIPASGADFLTPHYLLREYVVFLVDIILGNYSSN